MHWIAACIMFFLTNYCLQFRKHSIAKALASFFFLTGVWALLAAIIPHVDSLESKIYLNRWKMLSPTFIPLSVLYIAKVMRGAQRWPLYVWPTLFIIPCINILILASPTHHTLLIGDYHLIDLGGIDVFAYKNGPWFKFHNIQARLLILVAFAMLFQANHDYNRHHRYRAWLVNIAILLPFIADTIAVMVYEHLRYLQLTPTFLMISGLVMAYGILKHRLLDVVPFARSQILDNLSEIYLIFDDQDKLVDFNQTAAIFLGFSKNDFGSSKPDLMRKFPMLHKLSRVNGDNSEFAFSGEYYEVIQSSIYNNEANRIGSTVCLRNISLRKKAEKELKEISQMKSKLMAIMSHDLQGNLSSLSLTAERLLKAKKNDVDCDTKAAIEDMYFCAKTCIGFVDQLLLWSKSQLDLLGSVREQADVKKISKDAIQFLQNSIIEKDIHIEIHAKFEHTVKTDPKILSTILRNLISNAIRYTPEGGQVKVLLRHEDDTLWLEVEDSGPGLEEGLKPSIFTSKQTNSKSGLGLFFCAEFAQRLGGSISYQDRVPHGAKFTVELPC
ncbi:MAG: histidine kinase N-terminal 7TM domain-containing protein [Oligoflexus sp.]